MNRLLLSLAVVMCVVCVTALRAAESENRRADREIIIQGERELTQAYVSGDDRVL